MLFSEYYPDYFTATILLRKHLLKTDKYKDITISSLEFLVLERSIKAYGFATMSTSMNITWQIQKGFF